MEILSDPTPDMLAMPRFDDGAIDMQELLRRLAEQVVNAVMDAEADQLCGGGSNSRNGYRERSLATCVGTLTLRIPKLRTGSFFPEDVIERYQRADRALVAAVAEMYATGTSTRKVAPAGGAFGVGGVVDADGSAAEHVSIEPVDATASAGETGGPEVPGDGPSAPGTDPATGEPAADPSTNPTLKPAAATKTVPTTTVTNTTSTKTSRTKAATTTTASLPKAGDNCRIAASLTFFLLGTTFLCAAIRC